MNFSHYLGLVEVKKVEQFIFAQGNRPAAQLDDGQIHLLSEVFLFKEDLESIQAEILNLTGAYSSQKNFFLNGSQFKFEILDLTDCATIHVKPLNEKEFTWQEFLAPGYVQDWVESGAGLIVFYGADPRLVEDVRLSFAEQRIHRMAGKSLVFSSGPALDSVSDGEHFISSSSDESGFLTAFDSAPDFDAYFFKSDIEAVGARKLARLTDRGAFVALNSFWSDIDAVWTELFSHLKDDPFRDLSLKSILGFVGVRSAESADGKRSVVFEALPVSNLHELASLKKEEQLEKLRLLLKNQGVSFNQSLHSLVLKRKISLESAYSSSSQPEELNTFLSESGL